QILFGTGSAETRNKSLGISVWTVNDIERAKHLRDLGINGLITDFPKMMQLALAQIQ
ncbi:MAG: glycerophosphodiester phosphodiesterase family protein, partial [Pseudomonadota bacterium]